MKYSSQEWKGLREKILKRDNFTCQNCHDFNPQLGAVKFSVFNGNYVEIHEYTSNPSLSRYSISSERNNLTIHLDFGTDWLVLPILQVHHKKYIQGRRIWEYGNEDLVTLCKKCHKKIHQESKIPIYDSSGELMENKSFIPNDKGSGRLHDFESWQFIRKSETGEEYVFQGYLKPTVTYFLDNNQDDKKISMIADKMVEIFFEKFLNKYKRK